ncbi:ABC transporter substrate-binding protein [Teichococcus coralli]|nr:ABC transporter substrate-binding protein [Pseudoroseomonas coralli]
MVRTSRRTLLGQAALALTARPAAAQTRAAGAPELRIGAIFPAAGPLALHGDESFRGLELAVEARNAAGGVFGRPLRLVKAEASDATQAGEAARRLLAGPERVAALFGSCASSVSFAATQVAELEGVPYFELGAIADTITARGFRYLFRSCPRSADYAALTLRAALGLLPTLWRHAPAAMQVAILHENTLYGQSVGMAQEAMLKDSARLLGRFGYASGGQDIQALVPRLRAAETQLVLHAGQQADVLLLFRAMREIGWRPRMVLGAGAGYSLTDTAQALGPQVEGVMTAGFPPYLAAGRAGEEAGQLAEAYRGKYGHDPRSGHSLANFAGARLFLEALHRAGSPDKERIRAAVLATVLDAREAPLGWGAGFDEAGQNLRALPVLAQWQGGRLVPVFPEPAAAGAPRPELG